MTRCIRAMISSADTSADDNSPDDDLELEPVSVMFQEYEAGPTVERALLPIG